MYTCTLLSKEEILNNHKTVLLSFGISTADEVLDLPKLYWIPKLHKDPYKQRYITGSAKCSTKSLRFLQEFLRQLEMDFRNIVIHLTQEVVKSICGSYKKLLTNKLFSHGYRKARLVSTVKKFCGRHHDLVDP